MVSIELSFACLFFGVQLHASLKGGPSKKNKGKGGSHKILPLLEGSREKKFSYLGGSCNFLMTL